MARSSGPGGEWQIGKHKIAQHLRQDRRAGGNMSGLGPFMLDVACTLPAWDENHCGRADLGEMARIVASSGQDGHRWQALVLRRPCDAFTQMGVEITC